MNPDTIQGSVNKLYCYGKYFIAHPLAPYTQYRYCEDNKLSLTEKSDDLSIWEAVLNFSAVQLIKW